MYQLPLDMDQDFYHESLGSNIDPGINNEVPQIDPNLELMYASNEMSIDPALQHHLPAGYDVSMPDAAPQGPYYNDFRGMVRADSIAPQPEHAQQAPIVDNGETFGTEVDAEGEDDDTEAVYPDHVYQAAVIDTDNIVEADVDADLDTLKSSKHDYQAPVIDTENIVEADMDAEGEEDDDLAALKSSEHWKTLLSFDIPDHTQTHISTIPHLQALYTTYLANYRPKSPTNIFTRLQHAKALLYALLTHYYPTTQGYTITPTSLGPVAANGMSFILAAENNSDNYTLPPPYKPKAPKKSKSKKKKKRAPSAAELQAEREQTERDAKNHKILHDVIWLSQLTYDIFPHENIAGFVVQRKTAVAEPGTDVSEASVRYEDQPYTYAAIMIPDWDDLPTYSTTNSLHRRDVLVDAMCRRGNITSGYGILLYGPLLEFYGFDAGAEWVDREGDDDGEDEDGRVQEMEPKMEVLEEEGRGLAFDVREVGLGEVDAAFMVLGGSEVRYKEG